MGVLETDDATGRVGLPTRRDSADLYLRLRAIFLRGVKDRAGERCEVKALDHLSPAISR